MASLGRFNDVWSLYFHANSFMPHALREEIHRWRDYTAADFRRDLDRVIAGSLMTPDLHETLTGTDFDSQQEIDAYLVRVRAYLFEDGPWPEIDEPTDGVSYMPPATLR